jgi:hypothetical protein
VRRRLAPPWPAGRRLALGFAALCALAAAPAGAHHPEGSPAELPLWLMVGGAVVVLLGWALMRIRKRRSRAAVQAARP